MKKVNVTFSLPKETNELLHGLIGKRNMSSFVTDLLNKALGEKVELLRKAYIDAEMDPDRKTLIVEWGALDAEGWD